MAVANLTNITPGAKVTVSSSDGTPCTVTQGGPTGYQVSGFFQVVGNPVFTITQTLDGASNSPHSNQVQGHVVSGTSATENDLNLDSGNPGLTAVGVG